MLTKFLLTVFFVTSALAAQVRVIHVIVALCDNVNQGIVPVPEKIGNGQDPVNNLYWGCGYGVKTYFKKQVDWKLISVEKNPSAHILERLLFTHKDSSVYMVADAYDGAYIKQAVIDSLNYASGKPETIIKSGDLSVHAGGKSNVICYVGHDGLMDFQLNNYPTRADSDKRDVIILACASKNFFYNYIRKIGAFPLLWTTNLMCPEAYTLHSAIANWIKHADPKIVKEQAAQTYNNFQKCGIKGARNLLVTGF